MVQVPKRPPPRAPAKKAPAKKAPTRRAPAKKAPARKAPARKAPAARTPTSQRTTGGAPSTKRPAQNTKSNAASTPSSSGPRRVPANQAPTRNANPTPNANPTRSPTPTANATPTANQAPTATATPNPTRNPTRNPNANPNANSNPNPTPNANPNPNPNPPTAGARAANAPSANAPNPNPPANARSEQTKSSEDVRRDEQRAKDERRQIEETQRRFQEDTRRLAENGQLPGVLQQSFGDRASPEQRRALVEDAKKGTLAQPENVRFVDPATLDGKLGAYAPDSNGTVLLSRDLRGDQKHLDRVYREEVGHHLDQQLGKGDAKGDEGELFSRGIENKGPIDAKRAEEIRAQDDHGQIAIDGKPTDVEHADKRGGLPRLDQSGRGGPAFGGRAPGGQDDGGFRQQEVVRDNQPYDVDPSGPLSVENGGFPKGVGHLQGTPTGEQVQNAVRYMDDQMRDVQSRMDDARRSGDPQAYRQAFDDYRQLEKGVDNLNQAIEHTASIGFVDRGALGVGADMYQEAERGVLDNVGGYIDTFKNGERPPDNQGDLDYLAQLSVGGKDAPPNTPQGDKTMAHKMWDRLQADASKPGNEALRQRLDQAAANAGQQSAQAKKLYEQALFEKDPAKRSQYIDDLAKNGSLFYGQHVESLRATGFREGDAQKTYDGLRGLQQDGNFFAGRAYDRLGDDFMDRYNSSDPTVRTNAQQQLQRAQNYLTDIDNTDRTDFILHGLQSDSKLGDLTKARERLQTEVGRDNDVARGELDRVWTQENLTKIGDDPGTIADLQKQAESGNPVARQTMSALLRAPDSSRPTADYAPVSMERHHTGVRVPPLELATLNRSKVAAATSLKTDTSRKEAQTLAETLERRSANPDVRRAASDSITHGLREKNANTLAGMTDELVKPGERGYSRLSSKLREARNVDGFELATARLGTVAQNGNTRAIDALSDVSTVGPNSTDRDRRVANNVERDLVAAAKNGHASEVTQALLRQPDGGDGANYYRALGNAAGEEKNPSRTRNEEVMTRLRDGLKRGYDRDEVDPRSAHHGAAEGLTAVADRLGVREALDITGHLSPSTVEAMGKMSPHLKPATAEFMMESLRYNAGAGHAPESLANRAAEGLGQMGKWAKASDVDLLVRHHGDKADNTSAFSGVVNMLSRSDDARVRDRAVHALMDDPKASWSSLSKVDADTKKRLVDYVAGTGDWELQGDIGKLLDGTGIRPPLPALFSDWGVKGTKDEIVNKSLAARGHYGDDAVRNLGANVALWNRLPPEQRAQLLQFDSKNLTEQQQALINGPLHSSWAADRMAGGQLHETPAKFLLEDLDGRMDGLVADGQKRYDQANAELAALQKKRDQHLADLTGTTTEGVGFSGEVGHVLSYANPRNLLYGREPSTRDQFAGAQDKKIDQLAQYDQQLREKAADVSGVARDRLFLENANAAHERQQLIAEGRHVEAGQVAFDEWKKHGDNLKHLDPEMYNSLHRPDAEAGARGDGDWTRLAANDRFHLKEAPKYEGTGPQQFNQAVDVLGGPARGGERAGVVDEALKVIDGDENFARFNQAAGEVSQQLPTIQKMLEAGSNGTAFDAYVGEVRDRARPMLDTLDKLRDDKALMASTERQLDQLRDLEKRMADHPPAERQKIQDRIKAIEGMVDMAKDEHGVRGVLQTVLDDSKFRADTWSNWAKYEGPKAAGALAVGVGAAAFTAATFGAGAPLAAVAFAGAVGGVAGHEAMADAMHYYRNNYDPSVTNGRTFYSERSKFSHWQQGDEVYDSKTNQWRDRKLADDVLAPYAWDVGQNFAMSYATLGLGKAFSGGINSALGRVMGNHVDDLARISPKLAQVESVLGKEATQRTLTDIIRNGTAQTLKEIPQEIGEEFAENVLQKSLEQVDPRLGMLSSVLMTTGRGINIRSKGGEFSYDGNYADQAIQSLRANGHDVRLDPKTPGEMTVDGVKWRADGDVDPKAWNQAIENKAPAPRPDKFEKDPAILRDRAFAQRELAARLDKDLKEGRIPPGETPASMTDRVRRLQTEAKQFDARAAGAIDENYDPNKVAPGRPGRDIEYDGRPERTPQEVLEREAATLAENLGLPPAAAKDIEKYRRGLEDVSLLARTDPVAASKKVEELAKEWGLDPNPGDPVRIGSHELPALRKEAADLAKKLAAQGENMTEAEVLNALVNERFNTILAVDHGYNARAPDHRPKFPSDVTVNGADGKPRPLDMNDPAERAIAELHARAKTEEVMHSAGFKLGSKPEDYKPLFERTRQFGDWMNTAEGNKWLKDQGYDDQQIGDMKEKLLEADIMELHRSRAGFNEWERGRYPIRDVYDQWTGRQQLREELGADVYDQLDTPGRQQTRDELVRATRAIGNDPTGQAALKKLVEAGNDGRLSGDGFKAAAADLADFAEANGGRITGDLAGRFQRIHNPKGDAPQARAELDLMQDIVNGRTPLGDMTNAELLKERPGQDELTPEALAQNGDRQGLAEVKAVENLINRGAKRPYEAVKRNVKHAANQVVDYARDLGLDQTGVVRLDARNGTPLEMTPAEVEGLRNAINGELGRGNKLGPGGVGHVEVLFKDPTGQVKRIVFSAGPDGLAGDAIENVN